MASICPRCHRITSAKLLSPLHPFKRRGFRSRTASAHSSLLSHAEVTSARAYCSNLLKKYDNPSHVLRAFIPAHAQDAYLAIRAFNIDIARVADIVSNSTVGAMRMQFWRDTISKAFSGSPPKEPVAILLSYALDDLDRRSNGAARMSKAWFTRVINAREKYINNAPYIDMAALESYSENTYSTLLYLTLSALPLASVTADHLASHIGKAAGIVAVLRGLPLLAFPPPPNHHSNNTAYGPSLGGVGRQAAVMLPLDVMQEANVREEDVFRMGAQAPGLRDAVFAVATRASDHLITARSMLSNLQAGEEAGHEFEHEGEEGHDYSSRLNSTQAPGPLEEAERSFGVLMPAVATSMWLERLQKVDFDIFQPGLRTSDWQLPLRSWWAFKRRKL